MDPVNEEQVNEGAGHVQSGASAVEGRKCGDERRLISRRKRIVFAKETLPEQAFGAAVRRLAGESGAAESETADRVGIWPDLGGSHRTGETRYLPGKVAGGGRSVNNEPNAPKARLGAPW